MKIIFQHSFPHSSRTTSIDVAVLKRVINSWYEVVITFQPVNVSTYLRRISIMVISGDILLRKVSLRKLIEVTYSKYPNAMQQNGSSLIFDRFKDLTDKMKRSFFQAAVVSILLSGCTTWTLTKRLEKNLDGNYTRMLRAILNKSWRQHPTRYQLYSHLPPITKTIQARRTRRAGHCWRSRDELISNVLLWTPTYGRAKAGRPARTYIQQLCEDTGCSPEDLPEVMNDKENWRKRVRDIRAGGTTRWWDDDEKTKHKVKHVEWTRKYLKTDSETVELLLMD